MVGYYIVTGLTLFSLFILFLVISSTLNNIINQLLKLEYMFQKEYEWKVETSESLFKIEKLKERGARTSK